MRGDAGDVHRSRGDIDEEQDVLRDQALEREDLHAQEVRRRQTLPVSLQKRRPSGAGIALRSRIDAVLFEDVGDGAAPNLMPQINQRASDPRVTQEGFSIAIRRTRSTIVLLMRGLPGPDQRREAVAKLNDQPIGALTLLLPWEGLPPPWRYPIDFMVEREGLEPAGGMMRISNLLTLLEFSSPPLPSHPRIWH